MRSHTRSFIVAILAFVGALSPGSSALAEEYGVDFGADTATGRDAGTLTCRRGQTCHGELESLGLRVSIGIFPSEPRWALVSLDSREFGCCYFDGAIDKISVDPAKALSRVPLFKGAKRRVGMFIQNERVGTLYLRFNFH